MDKTSHRRFDPMIGVQRHRAGLGQCPEDPHQRHEKRSHTQRLVQREHLRLCAKRVRSVMGQAVGI